MNRIKLSSLLAGALLLFLLPQAAPAQWSTTPYHALAFYNQWQPNYSVSINPHPAVKLPNGDFLVMYFTGYYTGGMPHKFNYLQRLTPTGRKLWGPEGLPVVPNTVPATDSTQWLGLCVSDDAGGAILVWWDTRGITPNCELYGQRISGDGEWAVGPGRGAAGHTCQQRLRLFQHMPGRGGGSLSGLVLL